MAREFRAEGTFERIEKKYLLTKEQYNSFRQYAAPYISQDMYGKHTICNIYYDTDNYELIRHSLEKPKYKEKLRVRSYGIPGENDLVYLELKKKVNGIVYKRRTALTLKEANRYLQEGLKPQQDNQILREIDYFINFYHPEAKVYLAYDRVAYVGNDDDELRLTIDENIRSRKTNLHLGTKDEGDLLYGGGFYLMEIKVPMSYPIWLAETLSTLKIYPVSFSKYGNLYKENIYTVPQSLQGSRETRIQESMEDVICLQAF